MNKPTKPNITIPESFAANGVKADFDNNKILNGFDRIQPDVLAGDNLNKFIDDTYKGLNYGIKGVDYLEERWKSQITNCLLKVPQKIKLELVDGVLTLKAGSKLIFPQIGNVGGFTETVTTTDAVIAGSIGIGEHFIFDAGGAGGNSLRYCKRERVFSSETEPTEPATNDTWYDLTNHVIRAYQGGEWLGGRSFPIAIVTVTASGISIDHIFNGFGFIGNCWWVDKGVEALMSRGYNDDGMINNFSYKTEKVDTSFTTASDRLIILSTNGKIESITKANYFESEVQPNYTGTSSNLWYNPKTLEWKTYNATLGEWREKPALPIAWDMKNSAGQITEFGFLKYKSFRAMDYNEAQENLQGKANKTDVDGQWQVKGLKVAENVSLPVTTSETRIEYDLSDYLPKDNYNYEVRISCNMKTGAKSGAWFNASFLGSGTSGQKDMYTRALGVTAGSAVAHDMFNWAVVPVGQNRKLQFAYNVGGLAATLMDIWLQGYRRLGTNE